MFEHCPVVGMEHPQTCIVPDQSGARRVVHQIHTCTVSAGHFEHGGQLHCQFVRDRDLVAVVRLDVLDGGELAQGVLLAVGLQLYLRFDEPVGLWDELEDHLGVAVAGKLLGQGQARTTVFQEGCAAARGRA